MREGALLIDSSTIDPAVSKEMSKLAAESSATYMDAPVSGGSKIIFLSFNCEGIFLRHFSFCTSFSTLRNGRESEELIVFP